MYEWSGSVVLSRKISERLSHTLCACECALCASWEERVNIWTRSKINDLRKVKGCYVSMYVSICEKKQVSNSADHLRAGDSVKYLHTLLLNWVLGLKKVTPVLGITAVQVSRASQATRHQS